MRRPHGLYRFPDLAQGPGHGNPAVPVGIIRIGMEEALVGNSFAGCFQR
jgi:hypothetical protein